MRATMAAALFAAPTLARAAEAPPAKPIASLAWLVGGVWTADASKLGPGLLRIETRYQWSENGAHLRFTTHFVSAQGTLKQYDGTMFWSPAAKSFGVWYTDSEGAIVEGPMTWQGDTLTITFRAPDFGGTPADLRVDVQRQTADVYRWTLQEKAGAAWKTLAQLDYARAAGE